MCGIAGVFERRQGIEIDKSLLTTMTSTLVHRGPDDQSYYSNGPIGLGFRRLSIVDVASGNQPFFNGSGDIVVIANGEIYNHEDLRKELQSRGCHMKTRCDIEVIPHLYEIYGPEFLKKLNGQFAIALFDKRQQQLLLARDPVGIAPIFWHAADHRFLFGSEIKSLLAADLPRSVNLRALDQLLTFPGPVSPDTFFDGIHSLQPGHFLLAKQDGYKITRYWDLDYPSHGDNGGEAQMSAEDICEELDHRLQIAVARRLQGDVPVSTYVSGGLDSSLVAAILAKNHPGVVNKSFSINFPDPDIDERSFQQLVVKDLKSDHVAIEVSDEMIANQLANVVLFAETPLRESYNACSMLLSEAVNNAGRKVVMTGEGADELFAGYVGYRLDAHRQVDGDSLEEMLERQLRKKLWGDPDLFYEKSYNQHRTEKVALYSDQLADRHADFDCLAEKLVDIDQLQGRHSIHQRSYLDFKLRLADHLLADHGDRCTMANSVEARYPFLDLEVIDLVRQIPPESLILDGEEKALLKRLGKRYLPDEIVRRKKFSFVAPSSGLIAKHSPELVGDLLAPDLIRRQGYFSPDSVEFLRNEYLARDKIINQTFDDDLLMIVLTFGIWLDAFSMPDAN